jgi:uncharacterized protein YndB with AHSA1/START domain
MEIDAKAPAVASGRIEIDASPEIVWEVLATLDRWPSWNPDVKSVALDGPVAPGTRFRWRAGPSTITSTLREVVRPQRISWVGRTMGIHAVHVWLIEGRDGGAAAITRESWQGLLPRMFRSVMRRQLQRSTDAGLQRLKIEAERRAAASSVA